LALDLRTSDFAVGMGGLHLVWLAGAVTLGVNHDGLPTSVCTAPAPVATDGRIVCQANFEVVTLVPPTPAQRLVLTLTCEPVRGWRRVRLDALEKPGLNGETGEARE